MLSDNATQKQQQLDHLTDVNALRLAIASAITAIEKNNLTQLETDLATQESICNRLAASKWTPLVADPGRGAASEDYESSLLLGIRRAHMALAQTNRVYAGLLKRARRSSGLIVALYRSHGEGYDRSSSPLSQSHTWSCEV